MKNIILLILACIAITGCGNITEGKSAAQSQVAVFHQRFNAGNMEEIISAAHPDILKDNTRSKVLDFFGVVRRQLGKATDTQTVNWNMNTFNSITSVVLVQETAFENGQGAETFTFLIENGNAILFGYHINSKQLVME